MTSSPTERSAASAPCTSRSRRTGAGRPP
jgi:hypothetical protein